MKKEIVRIGEHSAARLVGISYAVIGLLLALCMIVVSVLTRGFTFDMLLILVLTPLLYGMIGYLSVWLFAILYNAIAKRVGGVVLHMKAHPEGDE